MLLMIDNYDSFTYNLYQYLCELGAEVEVVRNDKISLEEITDMDPAGIIISPGPSTPLEAGISNDVISHFGPNIPTLGVLGTSVSATFMVPKWTVQTKFFTARRPW